MISKQSIIFLFLTIQSITVAFTTPSTARTSTKVPVTPTSSSPFTRYSQISSRRYNIIDQMSSVFSNWGKTATASHILITPRTWISQEDAAEQLSKLKLEINDDPIKFAEAAAQISECPSKSKGGDLGEFGPGRMVVNFDKVCFNEEVGKVHGPVSTQFGEHLILITRRTGEGDDA